MSPILVIVCILGNLEHNLFLLGFCEQGGPQVKQNLMVLKSFLNGIRRRPRGKTKLKTDVAGSGLRWISGWGEV